MSHKIILFSREMVVGDLVYILKHVDFQVYENTEVKKRVALSNPYGKWISENLRSLKPVKFLSTTVMDNEAILRHQQ